MAIFHPAGQSGAREPIAPRAMVLRRVDSDGFLSDGEREPLTLSGSSSSAALSVAELVKKKNGGEDKQSKKPWLQQGDQEETRSQ